MMRPRGVWLGVIILSGLAGARPSAQERPSLTAVLERSGDYVIDFVQRFSNVVAEEEYIQHWRSSSRFLISDFLFVKQPSGDYMAFRDVFKVDGNAVRDHDARIAKLFLTPSPGAVDRAAEITVEGARHTFGGVFNNPVAAIGFLQPVYRSRFRFSLGRIEKGRDPSSSDVWIINFREQDRPTILRSRGDSDLPAGGTFWIEADTGQVLRTELDVANDTVVSYFQFDERFQTAVPVKMTERYRYMNNVVTGTATYGRFRRFDVSTEENVQ